MEIMATSKNYGKKKVRITSGIFWTLMGKNTIMEKSDAGAACLSWTVFFPIILSVTIHISNSLLILSLVSFFWLGVWPHACYALLLFCRLRKNRRRRRLKNRRGGLPRSARNRLRATMLISWEGPVGCWSEYGFSFYKRTMVAAKDDEQQTPDQFWKHLSC